MECPNCGARNAQGAKFCIKCGANLLQPCPNCGAENRSGARFCDECGHSLLPDGAAGSDESKGRGLGVLLAVVGLIVVLVALGAGVWFLGGKLGWWPLPEPAPSATQLSTDDASLTGDTPVPATDAVPAPPNPLAPTGAPEPSEPTNQVDASPGLILHAVQADDVVTLQPWLIVRDIEGEKVGQISLPNSPTYRGLSSLGSNLVATVENGWLLLNTSDFTAEVLSIHAEHAVNNQFLSGWPQRHAVLCDARGASAYLVDLETGAVFDLMAVDPEMEYVFGGQFSPHEEYLAFSADTGVWLLETARPQRSRKVRDTLTSLNFSDDGTRIAYIQRGGDGLREVVVESTDGSTSETVLSGDWFESVDFVPGQEKLVVMREGSLSLLSLHTGEEKELLDFGSRYRPRFAPSGHMLLAGTPDERGWHIVDLDQGTSRALDDITEFSAHFYGPSARWALFRDTSAAWAAGVQVAVLDLETGAVVPIRGLDNEAELRPIYVASSDARRLLMQRRPDPDAGREYWLVMADEGEARLLAEGWLSEPSLSADGRWLAYSQWHEDRKIGELILLDVDSGERRSLGEGVSPVWVHQ